MRDKQKAALSRFVLSNRERLIALMCRDKGFLMMMRRPRAGRARPPARRSSLSPPTPRRSQSGLTSG